MEIYELIIEAIATLVVNKIRTGLAILGIVIGIGSVISLISLGESSQKAVQSQIQSIGANLLTISPIAQTTSGVRGAFGGGTTLTYADALAIDESSLVTTVSNVAPSYSGRSQVIAGRNNTNTQIMGITPSYSHVRKIEIQSGSFINQEHLSQLSKVAVLGPQVVEDLFEGANPVGSSIRVEGQSFLVIGVTEAKGGSGPMNFDDVIYVPLTTAQKQLYGVDYVSNIYLETSSQEVMTRAQNQVGYLLLERHKISDPSLADFTIISQEDILEAATAVSGTFTSMLSGVAAISLLVGGIGIMNIMLVTVTERTREIGLRKALGAKKKLITLQFLIESVILTFAGGVLGILLGIFVSYIYSLSVGSVFSVSTKSVLLAFMVSTLIGIIFGWYPANKAADLQPIEALRYE